ncbi:MAG TPA: hypothetical protein VF121_14210 [Thermoanaerobaculia bacterium]|nr:hypothetical protein [Thermoanaerobaculia bacterium]
MRPTPLRRLRRRLILTVIVYCFAGAASQKLVPGVDEIFPFFGWSLFSKVPNLDSRYWIVIDRHDGRPVEPPVPFLHAPDSIVTGNRYIARKVIQRLGRSHDAGEAAEVERLRRLLERNYLKGGVGYELLFERYEPLEKWRTGASRERRSLARFDSGDSREEQEPR